MKHVPITSIRYKYGFTSSTYLKNHILTSSITGKICQWNLDTGNLINEFNTIEGTKFCIPYLLDSLNNYSKLVLQTQDYISLFDINNQKMNHLAQINSKCFARLSLLQSGSTNQPLIISPFDTNTVKLFDLRITKDTVSSSEVITIHPFKINHPQKSDLGILHFCQPIYSLGDSNIICTYESGTIAIFDIRNPSKPTYDSITSTIPIHVLDSLDPIPALSIWKDLLFIGDSKGNIWMFHVSKEKGISFIKKENLSKDSLNPPGISFLATRPDGAILVACCWDRCVRVLETRTLDLKCILDDHCSSLVDVSFSSNDSNRFCTSSSDGTVFIWDIFSNFT